MNCRKEDLAVIRGCGIPSWYVGRFLTVVEYIGDVQRVHPQFEPNFPDCWWVRPAGWTPIDCDVDSRGLCIFPDAYLRPIRPDDGVDEMLRIAGRSRETPLDIVRELHEIRETLL